MAKSTSSWLSLSYTRCPLRKCSFTNVAALKPGGQVFFVEPAGHVNQKKFAEETEAAWSAGLEEVSHPLVRHNHAVLLQKKVA